ncbi:MAG: hypothetical protein R2789_11565 [Microthrixaceae bacterium]
MPTPANDLASCSAPLGSSCRNGDELSVDEERDVVDHGVYPVLQHGGAFAGFPTVDVADVGRSDLVEELIGAELDEDVGQPGQLLIPISAGPRPRAATSIQQGLRGIEVIVMFT